MPWVYKLKLADYRDAETIQTDWNENIPGNASVLNDLGGVTVVDTRAVIVSERNNPEFEDMATLSYVQAISEQKQIPARSDADFDPPIVLAHGVRLME